MLSIIAADQKDVVTDWTSQGPAVVVAVVLSGLFLKSLGVIIKHFAEKDSQRAAEAAKREADRSAEDKARADALTRLGDGCHAFQERLQTQQDERTARTDKIVEDLAEIATRAKVALEQVERLLEEKHEQTTHDEQGPKRQNRRANG